MQSCLTRCNRPPMQTLASRPIWAFNFYARSPESKCQALQGTGAYNTARLARPENATLRRTLPGFAVPG